MRILQMAVILATVAGMAGAQEPVALPDIEVEARFIAVPATQLVAAAQAGRDGQLARALLAWVSEGKAELLAAPCVRTRNNQEAVCKIIRELIYPTAFTLRGSGVTNGAAGEIVAAGLGVEPSGFEMREMGVILQVVPEVEPSTGMINLFLNPQLVLEPEWPDFGYDYTDTAGNRQRAQMRQPAFPVISVSTRVRVRPGMPVLMGGGAPVPGSKAFVYTVVTARFVTETPTAEPEQ